LSVLVAVPLAGIVGAVSGSFGILFTVNADWVFIVGIPFERWAAGNVPFERWAAGNVPSERWAAGQPFGVS